MRLDEQDHARVTAAVGAAEARTAGEIVTIVTRRSDAYHDVALHWTMLAMLLAAALLAAFPWPIERLHLALDPWSPATGVSFVVTSVMFALAIVFLLCRLCFATPAFRMALTPTTTKARRVRARALALFRVGAEKRTVGATGVLLYLSLDEHRAEIIADAAIHGRVGEDVWGHAMASLITAVKDGRPGDGMADAVAEIGIVLAEHFPRQHDDVNELPDRLIEL